jgi:hypothetical protein
MTEIVTEHELPPDNVIEVAEKIDEKTNVESVLIENAVDMSWFIRATGPVGEYGELYEMSEGEFDDLSKTVSELLDGTEDDVKEYYGVGEDDSRYLVRIEYR